MPNAILLIGVLVASIGIFSYIRDTVRGKVKPNRVTWLLWAIAPLIATAAAISDGVGWAVLPVFLSGFGPLLVFIFSFVNKDSYWKLGRLDYICGLFSVLALILWAITNEPVIAIVFAIVSDAVAALPTVIKAWKYPETENAGPFLSGLFTSSTAFTAISAFRISEIAFPIYLISINCVLIFSILRNRFRRQPKEALL
ncbi:hypothetical protein KJ819_01975 [Patescibacteria group bacterium]|nr:hypothetical protein [Patescibacteria group bacterium]MBU1500948.1 hypothetical protein [Patescibacteria group bacterium]MBU2080578.1 hypothetical protein [Patescibacteria group bacterium]MBU2124346.1 hypothetical protein [Patescibacteria group bacterium]MBU2194472.1 hypothetical protein [Patescibacteria group bacterium]